MPYTLQKGGKGITFECGQYIFVKSGSGLLRFKGFSHDQVIDMYNKFNESYHLRSDNCQHFAEEFFKSMNKGL